MPKQKVQTVPEEKEQLLKSTDIYCTVCHKHVRDSKLQMTGTVHKGVPAFFLKGKSCRACGKFATLQVTATWKNTEFNKAVVPAKKWDGKLPIECFVDENLNEVKCPFRRARK